MYSLVVPHRDHLPRLLCRGWPLAFVTSYCCCCCCCCCSAALLLLLLLLLCCSAAATYCCCAVLLLELLLLLLCCYVLLLCCFATGVAAAALLLLLNTAAVLFCCSCSSCCCCCGLCLRYALLLAPRVWLCNPTHLCEMSPHPTTGRRDPSASELPRLAIRSWCLGGGLLPSWFSYGTTRTCAIFSYCCCYHCGACGTNEIARASYCRLTRSTAA